MPTPGTILRTLHLVLLVTDVGDTITLVYLGADTMPLGYRPVRIPAAQWAWLVES